MCVHVTHDARDRLRMALGARAKADARHGLRQSLTLVVIGITIGFLVALAATRVMATLLYGVSANHVSTYAIGIFLLGAAALLAITSRAAPP